MQLLYFCFIRNIKKQRINDKPLIIPIKKDRSGYFVKKANLNCINKFQSDNEKERSQNYTKKWIEIINKIEANKFDIKCK